MKKMSENNQGYVALTELIGEIVAAVLINDENTVIDFILAEYSPLNKYTPKHITYQATYDCCDWSWIEHINGIDALIGYKVNNVIEREVSYFDDPDGDFTKVYGWTIETAAGRCDIEMRNSSNGYYVGNLMLTNMEKVYIRPSLVVDDF